MGAGCSSSKPVGPSTTRAESRASPVASGPHPGHVYLSYHPPDTGTQRADGGDGAASRVRDWLTSRGYVVILGEPDPDAAVAAAARATTGSSGGGGGGGGQVPGVPPRRGAVGVQSGLELSWQARMQQCVERCQAFIALVSEHYGSRPEAAKEVLAADKALAAAAADSTAAGGGGGGSGSGALLPLWHSGPWPPPQPSLEPLLAPLQRVPRGPRPLCRTVLEGVMGELLERLQAAGCMPAPPEAPPKEAAAAAGAAAGGGGGGAAALDAAAGVAPAASLDWCFEPGPSDPPEADYAVVRCYTGKLQELSDRLALTVRPTVFDLGGETFSGDLPLLEAAPPPPPPPPPYPPPTAAAAAAAAAATAGDAGAPAAGGTLLVDRPHVTLRNGALLLRPDQELRIQGAGVVLDNVTVMTEPRQGGPRGVALGGGGEGRVFGAPYESGRAMIVLAGAVGVRMLRCQLTNHGPHLALWLAGGATAALRDCQLQSPQGAGAWVRDAGSTLVAAATSLGRCSGPCLQLEAGAGCQLGECSVVDSEQHCGALVGSGSRLRADRCVVSGCQTGVNLYGGASVELVGCELVSNALAGAEASEPGSSLVAVGCKLAMNGQSGLLVAGGASASLTSCTCTGNKAHGALVRGEGSSAALRQVTLSYNGQAGALLSDGGRGELAGCEAVGNKVAGLVVWGCRSSAAAADCRLLQNAGGGLALRDGAKAQLAGGCTVKNNRMPSEVAGAGSELRVAAGCVVDPPPTAVAGGMVVSEPPEGGGGGGRKPKADGGGGKKSAVPAVMGRGR